MLSYSVGQLVGYELPKLPFDIQFLQTLQKWTNNYSFVVIRFTFGLSVFLLLLNYFSQYRNLYKFVSLTFPIFCYASVVYLPFILIKHCSDVYISHHMFNMISNAFSGVSIKLDLITVLKYLSYLLIRGILILWWIWLIYTGTKFLFKQRRMKTALILSFTVFIVFQIIMICTTFMFLNWSIIKSSFMITLDEMGKETFINTTPPNYFKALAFASGISDNEKLPLPEYVRYVYKLKKVTYMIAFYKGNAELTSKALRGLKERNYTYVEKLLNEEVAKYSLDEDKNQKPLYYGLIKKDLEEAEKLRHSPNFVDFYGQFIGIHLSVSYLVSEPSYSINSDRTTLTIMCPIPPSLISVFP